MRLAIIIVLSCIVSLSLSAGEPPKEPPPFVAVGKVVELGNVETKRYIGQVTHTASVNLVARVSGELQRLGFKDGELVEKGQVLFQLDPIRYEAQVKSAEARVAECKARLEYAKTSYNRSRALFDQRATSKDALDSLESEHAASSAALEAAEAELITARDDLKNTIITAPISGKIGVSAYTEGNYLTPSSGNIATIIQLDPLRVSFAMSNRDFLSMFGTEKELKSNSVVKLRLADDSMYALEGEVEFIDNAANQRTDSILVYTKFANPEGRLIPGSTVTVHLSRDAGGRVAAVMPSAVMHDSRHAYVYVVDNENRLERRDVTLGQMVDKAQRIRAGVLPGEMVVVAGMHKARPGMEIEPDYVGEDWEVAQQRTESPDSLE